jgi:subtilase family serine protease
MLSSGVGYPAASPHVVSVGGTSLTMAGVGGQAWGSESVWGGSGGGCSVKLPGAGLAARSERLVLGRLWHGL